MSFLESNYLYFGLLLFSMAYPIAQSFEWRITYYKKWNRLFPAIGVMVVFFIPWDIWFTEVGVWWFNDQYITGLKFFGLPVEECLFFLIVPFACMFIYEVLIYFIKKDYLRRPAPYLLMAIGIGLLYFCYHYHSHLYPFVTFGLAGAMCLMTSIANPPWIGRFLMMYAVSWLPFLLVNGALTGNFTQQATVNYNPSEIIGFRVTTIPIEDAAYNLLMLLLVVWVYERVPKQHPITPTKPEQPHPSDPAA